MPINLLNFLGQNNQRSALRFLPDAINNYYQTGIARQAYQRGEDEREQQQAAQMQRQQLLNSLMGSNMGAAFGQAALQQSAPSPNEEMSNALQNNIPIEKLRALREAGIIPAQDYEKNGLLTTLYRLPNGQVITDRQTVGISPHAEEYLKNSQAELEVANNQLDNLKTISNLIKERPEDVNRGVGPINELLPTNLFRKDTQRALGILRAATGNISLEAAKGIKGAFTGRDQKLIENLKPVSSDNFQALQAKTFTLTKFYETAKKRIEYANRLVEQGTSPYDAMALATSRIPSPDIPKEFYREAEGAKKIHRLSDEQLYELHSKLSAVGNGGGK